MTVGIASLLYQEHVPGLSIVLAGYGSVQCFVLPVPDAEQREYNAGDKGADADHDIGISTTVQQLSLIHI